MAENKQDILRQLKEFEKEATAERREARELREDAVGLLTPALLRKHIRAGTGLVLAYGRKGHTVEFTIDDLKRFVAANERAQKVFRREVRGVPLIQLEKSSDPADIQRSRDVRSAMLYKVNKNLLHFSVSGNIKAHYQVRVRLEDWDVALHSTALPLVSARTAATGRISFDCSCGRHQFWYRYLTSIGGFDVNPPKEQDFPKIRNPGLKGCCCKHVLKVLRVLKSNTVHAVLAKEIERQSSTIGFADTVRSRFLKADELRRVSLARGVARNPAEARQAQKKFMREAQEFIEGAKQKKGVHELQKKLKPRKGQKPPRVTLPADKKKAIIESLRNLAEMARYNAKLEKSMGIKTGFDFQIYLENLSKRYSVPVDALKGMMEKEGLS